MFKSYPELNYYGTNQLSLPIEEKIKIGQKCRKPRIKSAKKIIVKFGISRAICYNLNNNKINHKIIQKNEKDKTTYQKDFCSLYKRKNDKNKKNLNNFKQNKYKNTFYDYLNIKQKNSNTNFDLKEPNNQNQYVSTYSESYRKPIFYYDNN